MGAYTGTVKFFNPDKGFGFITPKEGNKDIFVHISNVEGQIQDGDIVTYDVERGDRGLSALRVYWHPRYLRVQKRKR